MGDLAKAAVELADEKILVVDIERLPGLAKVWDQKTRFVHIDKFERLPSLLCVAAKWYGRKSTEFLSAWDDPERMVARTWELYNDANIVVTYNGIKFDNRHLRSEWLLAELPPPKPWKDVDLYRVNSQTFGFESKSLNHLCYRLGLDTKSGRYDDVMAQKALDGDEKSQRLMKRYNIGDVKITEQAYDRLRGWMPTHPVVGGAVDPGQVRCNQCGSVDLAENGWYLAVVQEYRAWRCNDCGANVRSNISRRLSNARGIR